jgi:caffeoyl-CoA O-methyltransferase
VKQIQLTEELGRYLESHTPLVHPVLADLKRETATLPAARMQISPLQGSFMHLLTKLVGARKVIEVGCFTGYSAISMASALPQGGKLYTLDVSVDFTTIAKRYFAAAGLSDKIELKLAPALETLPALEQAHGASFDLMFIDADKGNMLAYYEWGLKLLRPGGLIIADNVLWGGSVADASDQEKDTVAIRRFNAAVAEDERVDRVMLPLADGLFLARKR